MGSRIARNALPIPAGVKVTINADKVITDGSKGSLEIMQHAAILVAETDNALTVAPNGEQNADHPMLGTMWVLLRNALVGVTTGFEKRLQLVGVGYRGKVQGSNLELNLGYSHPVIYKIPAGINITMPSNTEVVVAGIDKQRVGQVSAEIRAKRAPERYKGKGVRYSDEVVILKEAKKK